MHSVFITACKHVQASVVELQLSSCRIALCCSWWVCVCVCVLLWQWPVKCLLYTVSTACLCSVFSPQKCEPVQHISTPASNSVTPKLLFKCAAITGVWNLSLRFFPSHMPVIVWPWESLFSKCSPQPQACNLYQELACMTLKTLSTSGQLESTFSFAYC